MKNLILISIMCLISIAINAQNYIDLGLPSGTKWNDKDESGFYNYKNAAKEFGNKLPTKEQLLELKTLCQWIWTDKGYKVVGPNGKSIVLPTNSKNYYWSSTSERSYAWFLYVEQSEKGNGIVCGAGVEIEDGREEMLVHLVEQPAELTPEYIDLGLSSGTKWMNINEKGYYKYDKAISKFGNSLPTEAQLYELRHFCEWTWTGYGYNVVGPNGKSIFLPAKGISYGGGADLDGEEGYYWSSTRNGDSDAAAANLYFNSKEGYTGIAEYTNGMSVRLVESRAETTETVPEYVDLGLPSGTKWMNINQNGYYEYGKAVEEFGNKLPTKAQFEELMFYCQWTWTANGYMAVGPNGKSIVLPNAGYRDIDQKLYDTGAVGYYWSSSSNDTVNARYLYFKFAVGMDNNDQNIGQSVRLVEPSIEEHKLEPEYVDLGLPSGTKWMNINENGYYEYDEAVNKFGDKLPTKAQIKELIESCQWTWTGCSYKVVGPNGKSIIMPAAGYRDRDDNVKYVGYDGRYWSSASDKSSSAWYICLSSRRTDLCESGRSYGHSVRLVQNK